MQTATDKGDEPENRPSPFFVSASGAQLICAPASEDENNSLGFHEGAHTLDVPARSQPIVLKPYRFRSGNVGFRLTGTVRGKRIDRKFESQEEAVEVQLQLEAERIHGSNAPRPKHTHLSIAEIREAEAAFGILKGTGLTLVELVRQGIILFFLVVMHERGIPHELYLETSSGRTRALTSKDKSYLENLKQHITTAITEYR